MRGFRMLLVVLVAVTMTLCDGVLTLLGSPTDDDIDQFAPEPSSFDIGLFHTDFLNQVGSQWTGFAYSISQNGRLAYSDGVGSWDVTGVAADETSKVYGASINKYVAAMG